MNLVESVFRWIHVVAGITWIGLLYFFNWVNAPFAPTLDADSKKKVVPELLPRALFWFRWGAAYTWVSGVILLAMVYYHGGLTLDSGTEWGPAAYGMLAIVFLGVFVYDAIMKAIANPRAQFFAGWILASACVIVFQKVGGFSYRGYSIHLGAMLGTFMAFNVWYRIWPAQQKIITAIKNGEAPDGALVKLAGGRSKHNTYMSIPLVFTMISQHATWASSTQGPGMFYLPGVILFGWWVCAMLYSKSQKVSGF
jgi:uncharacterized membrane protein